MWNLLSFRHRETTGSAKRHLDLCTAHVSASLLTTMCSPEKGEGVSDLQMSFVFGNSFVTPQPPHIPPEDAEPQEPHEHYSTETLCLSRTELTHVAESVLKNVAIKVSLAFTVHLSTSAHLVTSAAVVFCQEVSNASSRTWGQQFYISVLFALLHCLLILTVYCVIFSIYILKATRYPVSQIHCSSAYPTCCG